jgi:hypothetical protein
MRAASVQLAILVSPPRPAPKEEMHAVEVSFDPASRMKTDERRLPPGQTSGWANHCNAARDERYDHISESAGVAAP